MKKLLLILCLALLVGCSKNNSADEIGLRNPITERASLEEVNELTHGHIAKPGVMGITQEHFATIETDKGLIGQYDFVLNDIGYTIRFSDTIVKEDISGVWIDGKVAFSDDISQTRAKGADLLLARWFTVDGQYVLEAPDTITEDTFENIVSELSSLTVAN